MERTLLAVIGIAMVVACSANRSHFAGEASRPEYNLSPRQVSTLNSLRVFFGHQSVGRDILEGVREIIATHAGLHLQVVHTDRPGSLPTPALAEFELGANGDPPSKNRQFAEIVSRGIGQQGYIALLKYCFVDVRSGTNVNKVFADYRELVDQLQSAYPKLLLIHVTLPLTVVEPGPKTWLKSAMGRPNPRNDNMQRDLYNRLLRSTYPANRIFDLALAEATLPDGSRSFFPASGRHIDTLAPIYTDDGGHLNAIGRRRAALALLQTLGELRPSPSLSTEEQP